MRFTSEYFAYQIKLLWPILDFIAAYWHLVAQMTVLIMTLRWWLNLTMILLIGCFVLFLIRLTLSIN